MTNMLPPTRDLPPGRQARIRADLERAVSGRRSAKRYLVPILAGATAVTAVVTSVVLLQPNTDPKPAEQITPAPAPKVRDTFGLTPERVEAIEQNCAKLSDVPGGKLTLHQFDLAGTDGWALLYSGQAYVSCQIGRGGKEYHASGYQPVYVNWLAGHFTIDAGGAYPGGDTNPNFPKLAGAPGYSLLAGRVDSSVARITYRTPDGKTAEAKIANGTYAIRVMYPSTWTGVDGHITDLRVYDAAGNLLGTSGDHDQKCWTMPGVDEVLPDHRSIEIVEAEGKKCQPAPPWKWR